MSKDLINNIKNNWSNLLNYIYNNLFFNTDNDFQCIHLITDINYDYNYITFSLIYINNSKNVYILLSDHQDGVYNRLINKNNQYIINGNMTCIYGENQLLENEYIECNLDKKINIEDYIYVDWKEGIIKKNNFKKISYLNKLNEKELIKIIKNNSYFKFGLKKLNKKELIDKILNLSNFFN